MKFNLSENPVSFEELTSFKRLSCSTICFRSYPLTDALSSITSLGFEKVDIGTIPGFCPHFDFLTASSMEEREFVETIQDAGLTVNTFTTLIGQANDPELDGERILEAGIRNLEVAREVGALGVVFNCGMYRDRSIHSFDSDLDIVAGVLRKLVKAACGMALRAMVEAPHKGLFLRTPEEAQLLIEAIGDAGLGLILDINHYHASGW